MFVDTLGPLISITTTGNGIAITTIVFVYIFSIILDVYSFLIGLTLYSDQSQFTLHKYFGKDDFISVRAQFQSYFYVFAQHKYKHMYFYKKY